MGRKLERKLNYKHQRGVRAFIVVGRTRSRWRRWRQSSSFTALFFHARTPPRAVIRNESEEQKLKHPGRDVCKTLRKIGFDDDFLALEETLGLHYSWWGCLKNFSAWSYTYPRRKKYTNLVTKTAGKKVKTLINKTKLALGVMKFNWKRDKSKSMDFYC